MKKNKTIVVVGGVAGGMSFATRYRRLRPDDTIIVFEKGPYVSFANCGLPYHLSGEIPSRNRLLVVKEEDLVKRFRLDIRSNTEVIAIDASQCQITFIKDGKTDTLTYDHCVLSPGSKPIVPTIQGLEKVTSFTLRNIPDLDKIMHFLKANEPKKVIIVGAGYIGLEVAENLVKKGLDVTVVEKAPYPLPIFDPEMAAFAQEELLRNGVKLFTDNEIIAIDKDTYTLKTGEVLTADFAILSVGVTPENRLAQAAGCNLGLRGGIEVDEHYQTSQAHIYAVGDAIVTTQQITGEPTFIPLASPANRKGRQLADHLGGLKSQHVGSIGTAIVQLFNLSFASTGLNERQLKGRDYKVIHVHGYDHVSYYPGATTIDLKVLFDAKDYRILGAQAVGAKGVDKRIDVIATAIKAKMIITDLQELELTYAPPFGTAKDIVNMAGYIAGNMRDGLTRSVQWHEVDALQAQGAQFVDVRPFMERMAYGHIEGDQHIEIESLFDHLDQLPKTKKLITYCETGAAGYNAERLLAEKGYDVYQLDGGYHLYQKGKGLK